MLTDVSSSSTASKKEISNKGFFLVCMVKFPRHLRDRKSIFKLKESPEPIGQDLACHQGRIHSGTGKEIQPLTTKLHAKETKNNSELSAKSQNDDLEATVPRTPR